MSQLTHEYNHRKMEGIFTENVTSNKEGGRWGSEGR